MKQWLLYFLFLKIKERTFFQGGTKMGSLFVPKSPDFHHPSKVPPQRFQTTNIKQKRSFLENKPAPATGQTREIRSRPR
jgi:hypothetical protein